MNINQGDGDSVSILPKKMAVKFITQVIRSVMDQMPVNLITQVISSVMGPKVKMPVILITWCDYVHHGSIE
jgi:hypothetical protein